MSGNSYDLKMVDGNKLAPPLDSLIHQRPSRATHKAPWKTIEALYCAGVPPLELATEYNVSVDVINHKKKMGDWLNPTALKKKADALLEKAGVLAANQGLDAETGMVAVEDDPVAALALRIADGTISHKNNMLDEVERIMGKMKDTKSLKVRSISDLDKLDQIARRSLGLDADDKKDNWIVSLTSFDHPPEPAPIDV